MDDSGQQKSEKNQPAKQALRVEIRAKLKAMSEEERAAASLQACARLEQQPVWQKAKSVLFYAPLPGELDVWPLLLDAVTEGKTVLLPRFSREQKAYVACHIRNADEDIQTGQFGIREPVDACSKISLNRLDLILVPGIAFDLDGRRLGRGRGFYDQLLAVTHGPTCGVAFDQQIVSRIPVEPHDIVLSCILTPTRWRCMGSQRAVLK